MFLEAQISVCNSLCLSHQHLDQHSISVSWQWVWWTAYSFLKVPLHDLGQLFSHHPPNPAILNLLVNPPHFLYQFLSLSATNLFSCFIEKWTTKEEGNLSFFNSNRLITIFYSFKIFSSTSEENMSILLKTNSNLRSCSHSQRVSSCQL